MLMPWRWGAVATDLSQSMHRYLDRVRMLEPPAEDRLELQRHFIAPLAAEVNRFDAALPSIRKAAIHLQFRRLAHLVDMTDPNADPAHVAWRRAYGLEEQLHEPIQPLLAERAAAVGIATLPMSSGAPLSADEAAALSRRGPSDRLTDLVFPAAAAAAAAIMTAGYGVTVAVLTGLATLTMVGAWTIRRSIKHKQWLASSIEAHSNPVGGIALTYRVPEGKSRVWTVAAAVDHCQPVAATLAKRPPRAHRWAASAVEVFGDPTPGGWFAVRYPDGSIIGVNTVAVVQKDWPPEAFERGSKSRFYARFGFGG
jgi:hypothetical protein